MTTATSRAASIIVQSSIAATTHAVGGMRKRPNRFANGVKLFCVFVLGGAAGFVLAIVL